MEKENDLLSPDTSPSMLNKPGVKRANNVPLYIFFGVIGMFVMLICMVAIKRADVQNLTPSSIKKGAVKKDSISLAREVFENHHKEKGQIKERIIYEPPIPVSDLSKSNKDNAPNIAFDSGDTEGARQENERIRQDKVQQFEEAVKAKSSVMINRENITTNKEGKTTTSAESDVAGTFKEQLQLLAGAQKQKAIPQVLGGSESESRWDLNSTLQSPKSPYQLMAGSIIPGVMVSGVRSELPGQIIGQVSQDVYDTATGSYLLIPQGTKVLGVYSSDVSFGQDSVLIAWQRLTFPDGKTLDIGSMPGSDGAGYAGFRDKVNHHYVRIYGSALLMSAIVAGVSYSQNLKQANSGANNPPSAGEVLSQSLGQQLGETTSQLVSKNLNTAPTIEIGPGYRFNVTVVKDLVFKNSYHQFSY
tara:strand:- start:3558 stop:4805 length:1248 start_codon:yes stop_codon:yes gene_type:complete